MHPPCGTKYRLGSRIPDLHVVNCPDNLVLIEGFLQLLVAHEIASGVGFQCPRSDGFLPMVFAAVLSMYDFANSGAYL